MNRSSRFWLVLIGALVLVTVLIGGAGTDGPPLDPRSVNPDGARGIVEVLERLGARVVLDNAVPAPEAEAALLLQDRLTDVDRATVRAWVQAGGVLVVADPFSPLSARAGGFAGGVLEPGRCTIPRLGDAREITAGGRTFDDSTGNGCFGEDSSPFIVSEREGDGRIVSIGGPRLFTNEELGTRDNAYVAISLLAAEPQGSLISFVGPSQVEFGDGSFTSRVAPRVRNAIIMLLASFLLYALHRARRLGRVVAEPLPVQIRGSELVLQAGVLSQRANDPAGAAEVIREDFVEHWNRALGHADHDRAELAAQIAARHGLDADLLRRGLTSPITSDDELVRAVAALDAVPALDRPKGIS